MQFKNILILYKRSAYKIYFMDKKHGLGPKAASIMRHEVNTIKQAHDEHYNTLRTISRILLSRGVRYTESFRGRGINYKKFDLIFTIGGDGTFLEASRNVKDQFIIGVNSAPTSSVGRFCVGNAGNFETIVDHILEKKYKILKLHRLRLYIDNKDKNVDALNDILLCHKNPAVLCRYYLKVKAKREEHRSSGVWISSPAGSSGAIRSAGGRVLPVEAKKMQYLPRELYLGRNQKYQLKGGVLTARESVEVTSLMREGMIYVDGAHFRFPFKYGSVAKIKISPNPLKTLHFKL